jgi:catechol 2,3-dioxygenase-like lactoylglutathione lyase family enzyme
MLSDHVVYATIPTQDVERLRRFYEDVLGFQVLEETLSGIFYRGAAGTMFAVTRSGGKASGLHTQMGFRITNIEAVVAKLRARGVVFEEYESPKTVNSIADVPAGRAAWFRDPDGNVIGMIELRTASG